MDDLMNVLSSIRPDVNFNEQSDLMDSGILDSLDIVALLAEIEEQMGVAVPFDELTPENFNDAQSIYALIERLR